MNRTMGKKVSSRDKWLIMKYIDINPQNYDFGRWAPLPKTIECLLFFECVRFWCIYWVWRWWELWGCNCDGSSGERGREEEVATPQRRWFSFPLRFGSIGKSRGSERRSLGLWCNFCWCTFWPSFALRSLEWSRTLFLWSRHLGKTFLLSFHT